MKAEERTITDTKPKTASEIAEGIEPTKTGMDKVSEEMVADKTEKTNPNKDEKPGQEYGEN